MVSVGQVWGITGYNQSEEMIVVVANIIDDKVYVRRLKDLDNIEPYHIDKKHMDNTYHYIRLISG